jgi:Sulfotransferase family
MQLPMSDAVALALKNWIPFRLEKEQDYKACRWMYIGDQPFSEPFFDDTISRCRPQSDSRKLYHSISSTNILPQWAQQIDSIEPSAFIFHISRCGSTLLSQLLGQHPEHIVLSEVPFIDELLRHGFRTNTMNETLPIVKAAIDLYGARRIAGQQRLFIKTDSWHIHFYTELRALYPHTPFILLYRKPDEVLRSQQKKRGMQSVPGMIEPGVFGFDSTVLQQTNLDHYMASVIESYLIAFSKIQKEDRNTLLINYNEGGIAAIEKIAPITHFSIGETYRQQMELRSGYHAKNPNEQFQEEPTPVKTPAYLHSSIDHYSQLEKIRLHH